MTKERKELKTRLKEALEFRGIRAIELSERTGVPKGAISYYLSGKSQPKADRLHDIAKALDVSEAWLMGFDVPMNRTEEQKKNDELVQVVSKLRNDPDFFEVVSHLASLSTDEYENVKFLLARLGKK